MGFSRILQSLYSFSSQPKPWTIATHISQTIATFTSSKTQTRLSTQPGTLPNASLRPAQRTTNRVVPHVIVTSPPTRPQPRLKTGPRTPFSMSPLPSTQANFLPCAHLTVPSHLPCRLPNLSPPTPGSLFTCVSPTRALFSLARVLYRFVRRHGGRRSLQSFH